MTDETVHEQTIRSLPDFRVVLRPIRRGPDGRKVVDLYVVRENRNADPKSSEMFKSRSYDSAILMANKNQELNVSGTFPSGYEKTYLMTIGQVKLFRTVRRDRGKLVWDYVGELPSGETLCHCEEFVELSVNAVRYETERINRFYKEHGLV